MADRYLRREGPAYRLHVLHWNITNSSTHVHTTKTPFTPCSPFPPSPSIHPYIGFTRSSVRSFIHWCLHYRNCCPMPTISNKNRLGNRNPVLVCIKVTCIPNTTHAAGGIGAGHPPPPPCVWCVWRPARRITENSNFCEENKNKPCHVIEWRLGLRFI